MGQVLREPVRWVRAPPLDRRHPLLPRLLYTGHSRNQIADFVRELLRIFVRVLLFIAKGINVALSSWLFSILLRFFSQLLRFFVP